jgi:hypothetical protein
MPRGGESFLAVEDGARQADELSHMKPNTSQTGQPPVRLKPLRPHLTPWDRLENDLRLLSRALRAWELKRRRPAHGIRPVWP